jgi:hypothetical protein
MYPASQKLNELLSAFVTVARLHNTAPGALIGSSDPPQPASIAMAPQRLNALWLRDESA